MTHPALVNPFMFETCEPAHMAVADPCCADCGIRGPCDEHCPLANQLVRDLRELTQAFEIEPVPAFLTQGR